METIFDTPQCSIVHDTNLRVATVHVRDMKGLKKKEFAVAMHKLGDVVKRATPRTGPKDDQGGVIIVFDARQMKNLDLFQHVTTIGRWTKDYEKYTIRSLHYTLIVVPKKLKGLFKTFVGMFQNSRPVHIDTKIAWEQATPADAREK